jgi:hypothetical protein
MPSVVGLLEQRELTARHRVDELREEADRIHAELALAEQDWKEWVIARSRVGEVLAPVGDVVGADASQDVRDPDPQPVRPGTPRAAAKPKSMVPVWRAGLVWSALSVDYQRIVQALTDRERLGQGPLTCQEMAAAFGMAVVPAKVEALRSKAKRLVARRLAGRAWTGAVHARAGRGRPRRRVMSRVIDQ